MAYASASLNHRNTLPTQPSETAKSSFGQQEFAYVLYREQPVEEQDVNLLSTRDLLISGLNRAVLMLRDRRGEIMINSDGSHVLKLRYNTQPAVTYADGTTTIRFTTSSVQNTAPVKLRGPFCELTINIDGNYQMKLRKTTKPFIVNDGDLTIISFSPCSEQFASDNTSQLAVQPK